MRGDGKGHRDSNRYNSMEQMDRGRRHRHDQQFSGGRPRHGGEGGAGFGEYKTLCASNLNPSVQDDEIRDVLLHQFERFGNLTVKIIFSGDQRLAYLNFRSHGEASEAKHMGKDMILFDKKVHLNPVYGKPPTSKRRSSVSPVRSFSRERGSYSGGHSPNNFNRRRSDNFNENFDRKNNSLNYAGGFDPQSGLSQSDFGRSQKERFPHHLDHMAPEDDDRATRTLFVGNLDLNITEHGLRRIFERYGDVEEIDIKRPVKGQGNAYAFVKFFNLDMAHCAKVDMSGQFIGKFQCKIGYGKVAATPCVWVGGLEPWTTMDTMEREFDRFGMIRRVARPEGKSYGYILYDNVDAATAACQEMRGYQLHGQQHRIKTDYADIAHLNRQTGGGHRSSYDGPVDMPPENFDRHDNFQWSDRDDNRGRSDQPSRNGGNWDRGGGRDFNGPDRFSRRDNRYDGGREFNRSADEPQFRGRDRGGSFTRAYSADRNPDLDRHGNVRTNLSPPPKRPRQSPFHSNSNNGNYQQSSRSEPNDQQQMGQYNAPNSPSQHDNKSVENAKSVSDLMRALPVAWSGALVLKNSAFAACMHLVSGDVSVVDSLMRDQTSTELPMLRITQRLRLDQPKLDDVSRQVANSGPDGHAVLLAVPGSEQSVEDSNKDYQQRPLRNLVTYLKQKEAAGVIVQQPGTTGKHNGVMHSFPPCLYGHNYVHKRAPNVTLTTNDEDYLVVIVMMASSN